MVLGSMYGTSRPHIEFPKLLSLYKAGKLRIDELITKEFSIEQVNDAFDALSRGEVARSVIRLD